MTFVCQLCGECCSTMGEIIEILDKTGPFHYRIVYSTTGEERDVSIDPDKWTLFLNDARGSKRSLACPFLRKISANRNICTVHLSRPDLCRMYSCFRLLIMNNEGKHIGKVPERTRTLKTMDPVLRETWNREIEGIPDIDEKVWETTAQDTLVRNGFRVIC